MAVVPGLSTHINTKNPLSEINTRYIIYIIERTVSYNYHISQTEKQTYSTIIAPYNSKNNKMNSSTIVTVSVQDAWKDGVSMEAIRAVQLKFEKVANSIPGVLFFRFGNNEDKRVNAITEVYANADAFLSFLDTVQAEGGPLPELFAVADQVPGSVLIQAPQSELNKLADVVAAFNATVFVVPESSLM